MSTRLLNITASIDVTAERVVLCEPTPNFPIVQIGAELTLHVHEASPETLRAIALAFAKAADMRALKAVAA